MIGHQINTTNISVTDDEYIASKVAITVRAIGASVCYLVSLFIVVVNTLFLICFYINRRKEWVSHSKNIISLLIMDWLVGVTGVYMLAFAALKHVNLYLCTFSQTLCISSQVGSHMNIFRLCVLRLKSARTRAIVKESSTRSLIIQTVLVYIISTTICSLPVYIWGTKNILLERCLWTLIYEQNVTKANTYMLYVTLIPTVATSVLYVALCVELKRSMALVTPLQTGTSNSDGETSFANDISRTSYNSNSKTNGTSGLFMTNVKNKMGFGLLNGERVDISVSKKQSENASVSSDLNGVSVSPKRSTKTTLLSTTNSGDEVKHYLEVPSTSRHHRNARPRHFTQMTSKSTGVINVQRARVFSVFKTVGAILFCMNISILPYIIAVGVSVYQYPSPVSGDVFFFVSSLLLLNSALDPIIYIIRIKHLKIAFRRMIRGGCCA